MNRRKIKSGLYLVVDPAMEEHMLLERFELFLQQELAAVQLWDNFENCHDVEKLLRKVTSLCHKYHCPLLINNRWEWLQKVDLDGVHLDDAAENIKEIKEYLGEDRIIGLTCNNDLKEVEWAEKNQLDYISFCSIFPSSTSNSCELVSFENIKQARKLTQMPIFLAGGINPDNMQKLSGLPHDGVAVVSGLMGSTEPEQAIQAYLNALKINK